MSHNNKSAKYVANLQIRKTPDSVITRCKADIGKGKGHQTALTGSRICYFKNCIVTGNIKNNKIAILLVLRLQFGGPVSLSINKYLRKAEIHMKAGEAEQAQKLYAQVLSQFPKNKKAIQGYQKLKNPPQVEIDRLISLFNSNQLRAAVSLGATLKRQFPGALILYEILGAANLSLGLVDDTIKNYQKVLELNPKHTDAYNNLGMAFYEQGKFAEAAESYQKAVELEPSFANAHYNLGNAFKQIGDLKKAIESYRSSLAINSNDIEILSEYGNALRNYGEFEKAIECYKKILALNPSLIDIQTYLDDTIKEKKEIFNEIKKEIIQESSIPETAQFMHQIAILFYGKGNIERSLENLESAIKIHPTYDDAYVTLGIVLSKTEKIEKVIDSYIRAIKVNPDNAKAYNNLGTTLKERGEIKTAIKYYQEALKIKPDYALAFSNLGSALQEIGDVDAAIDSYENALKIKPNSVEVHYNQSLAYLYNGDFKLGWAKYEWRWQRDKWSRIHLQSTKPLWNPAEKNRVLLWAEQGIGDEIMFASVISDLYASCSKLIVKIDKRLIPIFRRSFPDDIDFRLRDETVSETEYDAHVPMGSLPLHFRQTSDSFKPSAKGWLSACDTKASRLRKELLSDGSETLIGISWHSSNYRNGAEKKVMDLTQLAKKLHAPKVKLINLQYGEVDKELDSLQKETGIEVVQVPDIDNMDNIDDLAALIMACDKVVSISNVTIHLAGALGKEAHILLASLCDWRWGQSGNSSYWYNSVRLCRQTKVGNWHDALRQL